MNREVTFPVEKLGDVCVGDTLIGLACMRVTKIEDELVDMTKLDEPPGSNAVPGRRTVTLYCTDFDVREKGA